MTVVSKSQEKLRILCSEANRVRENYYSVTYRASFSVSGESGTRDIRKITVPFEPRMEARLRQRFGLEPDDLPGFYENFRKALSRSFRILNIAEELDEGILRSTLLSHERGEFIFPGEDDSLEVYILSEPSEAFAGSGFLGTDGAKLTDILHFGSRCIQTIKSFNDRGISLGAIDIDSCVMQEDTNGRKFLKWDYFLYATRLNDPRYTAETYTADAAVHMDPQVVSGKIRQSVQTDLYMITDILWSMLDGHSWNETADWSRMPRFADEELAGLLKQGHEKDPGALKALNYGLRRICRKSENGEIPDTFIPFSSPAYLLRLLPEHREEKPEEAGAEPPKEEEQEEPKPEKPKQKPKKNRKKRKRIVTGAVLLTCTVLTVAGAFAVLRPFQKAAVPAETVTETAEPEEPAQTEQELTIEVVSAEYVPPDTEGGGIWQCECRLKTDSTQPVTLVLQAQDTETMCFAAEKDGETVYAKTVKLRTDRKGTAEFTVIGFREGTGIFTAETEDGSLSTRQAVAFRLPSETPAPETDAEPDLSPEPSAEPSPSAVPAPTPSPSPTPSPAVTPTPSPAQEPDQKETEPEESQGPVEIRQEKGADGICVITC